MPNIRFPRLHIAESVVNRILNGADEIEARFPTIHHNSPQGEPAPYPADPTEAGIRLDEQLGAPTPDLPGLDQTGDPGGTLQGRKLLSTLIDPEG